VVSQFRKSSRTTARLSINFGLSAMPGMLA
jgi:hypothetical protein